MKKQDEVKSSEGQLNNQLQMLASGTHFGSQVRFVEGVPSDKDNYN